MTPATPEFCPQLSVHKYFHSEPQQLKGKHSINLVSASSFWPLLSSSQRKSHHSTAAGGAAVSLGRVSFGDHKPRCLTRAKVHVSLYINRRWFQDTEGKSRESEIPYFSQGRSLSLCSKTVPISRVLYLEDTL